MIGPLAGTVGIFPGPPEFVLLHERAMPQKDQLCGAFWGALTLSAAGHTASQEEVALRAGTTLAEGDPAGWLPPGATPRTDYEATIPVAPDRASAGTSATGVARSIEELSGGALAVVPVAEPWSADTVVRSWFSKDLLDCYLSVKRTEISLLEGLDPQEACERYLRVY